MGGVRQLQDARDDEASGEWRVGSGGEDGELLHIEKGHGRAADLLAGNEINGNAGRRAEQTGDKHGASVRREYERHFVPDRQPRQQARDEGALVRRVGDVSEPHQPAADPLPGDVSVTVALDEALFDVVLGHPVAGKGDKTRVGVLRVRRGGQMRAAAARDAFVGSETMVEVPDHLRLVQRQIARRTLLEHVPVQRPAVGLELLARAE